MKTKHQEGRVEPPLSLTIFVLVLLVLVVVAFVIAYPHLKSSVEGAWDELWYWLTRCCL